MRCINLVRTKYKFHCKHLLLTTAVSGRVPPSDEGRLEGA